MPSKKTRIVGLFGWALSAVCLYLLLSHLHWSEFIESIKKLTFLDLLVLNLIYLSGFLIRGIRSKILLPEINYFQAFGGVIIGYAANNLLPARLGEVVRAQVVGKHSGISRTTTFSSIMVERILDGLAIVLLLLFGSKGLDLPDWAQKARLGGMILFGGAFLGVFLFGTWGERFYKYLPPGKIQTLARGFGEGVHLATRSVVTLVLTIALSLFVWTVEGAMFYLGFVAFGIDLSFHTALFVMAMVNLGVLIPSSPGNVGLFQYVCVLALSIFAVPHSEAVAYSIVVHMCQYLPVTIIGVLLMPLFGLKKLRQIENS